MLPSPKPLKKLVSNTTLSRTTQPRSPQEEICSSSIARRSHSITRSLMSVVRCYPQILLCSACTSRFEIALQDRTCFLAAGILRIADSNFRLGFAWHTYDTSDSTYRLVALPYQSG